MEKESQPGLSHKNYQMTQFNKILVANRGEIACRIIRSIRESGCTPVAVFAKDERNALHVKLAVESYSLGSGRLTETYLNQQKIIDLAKKSGAQAIHPGYGFLSENEEFARKCSDEGLIFIGPPAEAIQLMGNKVAARNTAESAGVPILKGIEGDRDALLKQKAGLPYPVLIKAAAGGGGKGMRKVLHASDFEEALDATIREASSYFGNGQVFIERFIENPRHVEVQVMGDQHGNVVHLFERECTLQRRHQKIIEEAPSPTISESTREKMTDAAVALAKQVGYFSAGTVEFLVDEAQNFYFLEMNTRIQVEHPVTEFITGKDLVREQINVAQGKKLSFQQSELAINGHAIECRVYAEDPSQDFIPSPGEIIGLHFPEFPELRMDTFTHEPTTVQSHYDPMIAKVIQYGEDRSTVIDKMVMALSDTSVQGIKTNVPFLLALLQHSDYLNNQISTHYIDDHLKEINEKVEELAGKQPVEVLLATMLVLKSSGDNKLNIWNEIGFWRQTRSLKVDLEGKTYEIHRMLLARNEIQFEYNDNPISFHIRHKHENVMVLENKESIHQVFFSKDQKGQTLLSTNGFSFTLNTSDNLQSYNFSYAFEDDSSDKKVTAPMHGSVVKLLCQQQDEVQKGQKLIVVEAMKMENTLVAPMNGKVVKIMVKEGQQVEKDQLLIEIV